MTAPYGMFTQMARRRYTPGYTPEGIGDYTGMVDEAAGAAGARGEQAQNAYVSRASTFDASQALNQWAKGAYGSISTALNTRLRDLAGGAARSGRLKTGFYDEDQGQLVRGAQEDFSNALASQALGAAGLQQRNDEGLGAYGERQTEYATDVAQSRREELINAERERQARARQRKRGIGGLIGGALGAAGGFALGGPGGAMTGWNIGRSVAGGF